MPKPPRTALTDDALRKVSGGSKTIQGGTGHDSLHGSSGDDAIHGGAGNDTIFDFGGHDAIHGGAGNDFIRSFGGDDQVTPDSGNDTVYLGEGHDLLLGGGGGHDIIYGEGGDDTYWWMPGNQSTHFDGGPGKDTLAVFYPWFDTSKGEFKLECETPGRKVDGYYVFDAPASGTITYAGETLTFTGLERIVFRSM
jgi:Ca2+-binding RTX toxin-like protein